TCICRQFVERCAHHLYKNVYRLRFYLGLLSLHVKLSHLLELILYYSKSLSNFSVVHFRISWFIECRDLGDTYRKGSQYGDQKIWEKRIQIFGGCSNQIQYCERPMRCVNCCTLYMC